MNEQPIEPIPASVRVDRELCITAGICLAYGMYELDDEGKAVLLTKNGLTSDDPTNTLQNDGEVFLGDLSLSHEIEASELAERVLESARACPFNAIIVNDAEGNQIWPPLLPEPN